MIFGLASFCWFGGCWHDLSHGNPNKVVEECSQDKFPDPVEAAGGGQLMDGRGRNSQLPSNRCLGNKLLLSLVSAPALQAPLPCRVLSAPHPSSASLEMLPQEQKTGRTSHSVLSPVAPGSSERLLPTRAVLLWTLCLATALWQVLGPRFSYL